jgi:hypothetical protein
MSGPDFEERMALSSGCVPALYLDAWARLQCQKPFAVADDDWRRAINDAGLFFDAFGPIADDLGWKVADLFDVPRPGRNGGLIWWLKGEALRALGPGHAIAKSGRATRQLRRPLIDN